VQRSIIAERVLGLPEKEPALDRSIPWSKADGRKQIGPVRIRYKTVLWPVGSEDNVDWDLRLELWRHDDAIIGRCGGGAHLNRLLASPYPTRFLAKVVREGGHLSLEEAVHRMTDKPARLFGLLDRGRIVAGSFADIVVFAPASINCGRTSSTYDLPGDSLRLAASAEGIEAVLVNGVETIIRREPTGALPGTMLGSGRDIDTVSTR
jgi:N-acyl-D-aspartate/D-glutamate deacylase